MDRPTTQRSQQRRVQILAAAAELFAARGFRAVSMAEIVAAAGVSMGTAYRYFDTKEAIVAAVSGAAAGIDVTAAENSPVLNLEDAVEILIEQASDLRHDQLSLQIWADAISSARSRRVALTRQDQIARWLARAAEGLADGEPSAAMLQRARVATCAVSGLQDRLACGISIDQRRFGTILIDLMTG